MEGGWGGGSHHMEQEMEAKSQIIFNNAYLKHQQK